MTPRSGERAVRANYNYRLTLPVYDGSEMAAQPIRPNDISRLRVVVAVCVTLSVPKCRPYPGGIPAAGKWHARMVCSGAQVQACSRESQYHYTTETTQIGENADAEPMGTIPKRPGSSNIRQHGCGRARI